MIKISQSWFWQTIVSLLLLMGVVYLHFTAARLSDSLREKKSLLDNNPTNLVYSSSAKSELSKRKLDLDRIKAYTPDRNNIAEVVTAIEAEGRKNNVLVSVTDIQEQTNSDAAGQTIPATGPLQDVRLKITGVGQPANLVQTLHSIEHLPYLLHFDSWDLVAKSLEGATNSQAQVPVDNSLPLVESSAIFQADIILSLAASH